MNVFLRIAPSILINCKVFADKMCSEKTNPSK